MTSHVDKANTRLQILEYLLSRISSATRDSGYLSLSKSGWGRFTRFVPINAARAQSLIGRTGGVP